MKEFRVVLSGVECQCGNIKPHWPHTWRGPGDCVLLCTGVEERDYQIVIRERSGGDVYDFWGANRVRSSTTSFRLRCLKDEECAELLALHPEAVSV